MGEKLTLNTGTHAAATFCLNAWLPVGSASLNSTAYNVVFKPQQHFEEFSLRSVPVWAFWPRHSSVRWLQLLASEIFGGFSRFPLARLLSFKGFLACRTFLLSLVTGPLGLTSQGVPSEPAESANALAFAASDVLRRACNMGIPYARAQNWQITKQPTTKAFLRHPA